MSVVHYSAALSFCLFAVVHDLMKPGSNLLEFLPSPMSIPRFCCGPSLGRYFTIGVFTCPPSTQNVDPRYPQNPGISRLKTLVGADTTQSGALCRKKRQPSSNILSACRAGQGSCSTTFLIPATNPLTHPSGSRNTLSRSGSSLIAEQNLLLSPLLPLARRANPFSISPIGSPFGADLVYRTATATSSRR
jgi:hypothetical protein